MTKQKKTALDLACEHMIKKGIINCAINCPLRRNCSAIEDEHCIKEIKQYFQEQADIPDGWDVVKEKIKQLKNSELPYKVADAYVLEKLCWENGIEVNDE